MKPNSFSNKQIKQIWSIIKMTETVLDYKTEFKITNALSLRLKHGEPSTFRGKTVVVVNGKEISHCMFLMLNIPLNETHETFDYVNMDEMAEKYSADMEHNKGIYDITPEQEFWGHCSNLQTWVDNGYDPTLLRSNLAIPLLKELVFTDINVFHKLLYHLDGMWKAYKTKERRSFVFSKFASIIMNCLMHYKIKLMDVYNTNAFLRAMKELSVLKDYVRLGKHLQQVVNNAWRRTDICKFLLRINNQRRAFCRITYENCNRIETKELKSLLRKRNYWERKIWGTGSEALKHRRWLRRLRDCNVSIESPEEDYPAYMWSKYSHSSNCYPQWSSLESAYKGYHKTRYERLHNIYRSEGITHYYTLNYEFNFSNGWAGSYTIQRCLVRLKDGSFAVRHLVF